MQHIGFIGIGSMGLPMARNLLRAGYPVSVYNRTRESAKVLESEGARLVDHPRDVLSEGGVVITILSNDAALEQVVHGPGGLGEGLRQGHIHLSMSTVAPETSRKLDAFHKEKGAHYLVATVSGRPEGAAAQKLWIFLAGEPQAKKAVSPILNVLGQRTFDVGEDPTCGNVVKLCGNFLILSAIEALAEALTFAEKNGVTREAVAHVFTESLFACPIYQLYAKILVAKKYEPAGFKLNLGLKDIQLVLDAAKAKQVPMPLASLVYGRLLSAVAKGRSHMDWSAIGQAVSEDAGV